MRRGCISYSEAEMQWLESNRMMIISDYHRAFVQRFKRDDVTAAHLHGLRKRKRWKTGRTGHFEKGCEPANKGKTMPYNANSARTRFKTGDRPHTWRGAGHESIGGDGYVWLIVDEENPYTGAATRRVQKHRWLWQQKHGPIPDGHVLKCIDGDKTNTAPTNWECVPTGLLPRLNGKSGRRYDQAPAELKPVILAVAKLEHASRKKREAAE